jgi:hypothetical protein
VRNNLRKWQLVAAIFFIFSFNLNCENTNKDFEFFFKKLYKDKVEGKNQPLLAFNISSNFIYLPNIKDKKYLPKTFSYEFFYGFFRESDEFYYDDFTYHSSEFAFGGNTSSKLDPNKDLSKIYDSWRFGIGWQNGYKYNLNNLEIYLVHKGTFNWTNLELNYNSELHNINKFQSGLKFGTSYASGVMIKVSGPFQLGIMYEESQIHPKYTFSHQLLSLTIESILQRGIEFFEYDLIYHTGKMYPIYNFIYKTSISAILYKVREQNVNFPISSPHPIVNNSITLNFVFTF